MEKTNVLVYVRTSKKEENELAEKMNMIKEFAKKNNLIIQKVFVDINVAFSLENEEFKNMLAESKKNNKILVYSCIDLTRNYKDLKNIKTQYNLEIYDCSTDFYSQYIKEKVKNIITNIEVS